MGGKPRTRAERTVVSDLQRERLRKRRIVKRLKERIKDLERENTLELIRLHRRVIILQGSEEALTTAIYRLSK